MPIAVTREQLCEIFNENELDNIFDHDHGYDEPTYMSQQSQPCRASSPCSTFAHTTTPRTDSDLSFDNYQKSTTGYGDTQHVSHCGGNDGRIDAIDPFQLDDNAIAENDIRGTRSSYVTYDSQPSYSEFQQMNGHPPSAYQEQSNRMSLHGAMAPLVREPSVFSISNQSVSESDYYPDKHKFHPVSSHQSFPDKTTLKSSLLATRSYQSSPLNTSGREKGLTKTTRRSFPIKTTDRTKKQPLRPLSAYNYFFLDERNRIIKEDCGPPRWNKEHCKELLLNHWTRDRNGKRSHRKTHGRVSFMELTRLISSRWKETTKQGKDFYKRVAKEDMARYKAELEEASAGV